MKKLLLTLSLTIFCFATYAQNTFPASGNVGIGTTNPTSTLDIGGNIQLSGINSTTPPQGLNYGLFPYGGIGLGIFSGAVSAGQGIGIWTNLGGTPTEVMRINNSGNVGIGTTSPGSTLTVVSPSTSNAGNFTGGFGGTNPVITINNILGQSSPMIDLIGTTASYPSVIRSQYTLQFNSQNNGNINLMPNGTGGVGVNTSNTNGYMLAINGSAIATSVTVKQYANWPDYVFKSSYKLPPLSLVKAYINQNHHLPDVPSEQEVEKQGQNLGEMNKLLLKKVEELTLYLIEKDQKDSEQQQQLNRQSAQLESQQEQLDQLKAQLNNILSNKRIK